MEESILIAYLNDFIFCPASIYFHILHQDLNKIIYQEEAQLNGTKAHESIDNKKYSSKKNILQGVEVYSEKYKIMGKIDLYDADSKTLAERKNQVVTIYDGYIFQLYAQYFCLIEMGYEVNYLRIYSMKDNKMYQIKLPDEDFAMFSKFEQLINDINKFDLSSFQPETREKCQKCIYESLCDRSIK